MNSELWNGYDMYDSTQGYKLESQPLRLRLSVFDKVLFSLNI